MKTANPAHMFRSRNCSLAVGQERDDLKIGDEVVIVGKLSRLFPGECGVIVGIEPDHENERFTRYILRFGDCLIPFLGEYLTNRKDTR